MDEAKSSLKDREIVTHFLFRWWDLCLAMCGVFLFCFVQGFYFIIIIIFKFPLFYRGEWWASRRRGACRNRGLVLLGEDDLSLVSFCPHPK